MRYIKTYESFYSEDDMAREMAMLLDPATVERFEFDPKYKDTSMFRVYELEGRATENENIGRLISYMKEHNLYLTTKDKLIILTEKLLKETCIDWLNKNYSGLKAVDSKDYPDTILYRYEPKDNILFYDKKRREVWVRYNLIWTFFKNYFGLDNQEIKDITEKWLSEAYNLRGITTSSYQPGTYLLLSEAYNIRRI